MNETKPEESEFKVIDKRRFTEDGESRGVDETQTSSSAEPPKPEKPVVEPPKQVDSQASEQPIGQSTEQSRPVLDFSTFAMSLAHQALVLMGEAPNPESNVTSINAEAARQTIDILGILEEKTKGNLSKEEEHLLVEVLSSLRLAYVNKIQGGGS